MRGLPCLFPFGGLGEAVDDHGFDGRQHISEKMQIDGERLAHCHHRAKVERERLAAHAADTQLAIAAGQDVPDGFFGFRFGFVEDVGAFAASVAVASGAGEPAVVGSPVACVEMPSCEGDDSFPGAARSRSR